MEIWTNAAASPRGLMRVARDLEENGWDGVCVVDSQNLSGDPYVALAMAATVTGRIGLGTGVTNPVTRTAAVTAAAIASVQLVSKGRACLGIGRGDSALAHLGRAPARLDRFERYLRHLQAYLRAEEVPLAEIDIPDALAPPVGALELADAPPASRIGWIAGTRKVPVEVAATGPRVIAMAALLADRVMFALGADRDRLAWGIDLARRVRREAGLDPDGVAFGAYINCACHPDIEAARRLVRGGLTTFARFSVMHGKTAGPLSPAAEKVLHELRDAYDMRAHTRADSRQAAVLTPDFIDHFAVVGPPEQCIGRLRELARLGLTKLVLGGNIRLTETAEGVAAKALMERELLPALRA